MAKKNKPVILDSGVVFDYLKGNEKIRFEIFEVIGVENTYVSTVTILETYYGMLKKRTKKHKIVFSANQSFCD